ncbi:hypothetical protein B0O99DRAFT_676349 [Bisporella sp. PMI_857]|nr:hypothetical protein B0O99DRAFT_676349 [Bisporella sp. PMI_857]
MTTMYFLNTFRCFAPIILLLFHSYAVEASLCSLSSAVSIESVGSSDSTDAQRGAIASLGSAGDELIVGGVKKRAVEPMQLDCTPSESCLSVQREVFCVDPSTLAYHDAFGTVGNLVTGEYTLVDGRRGNLYAGPFPSLGQSSLVASTILATPSVSIPEITVPVTSYIQSTMGATSAEISAIKSSSPTVTGNTASTRTSASTFISTTTTANAAPRQELFAGMAAAVLGAGYWAA